MLEYNSNIIPIPVIASFNTSGKIKPIYFQFENENYKIMDVITSHTEVSIIYFVSTLIHIVIFRIELH